VDDDEINHAAEAIQYLDDPGDRAWLLVDLAERASHDDAERLLITAESHVPPPPDYTGLQLLRAAAQAWNQRGRPADTRRCLRKAESFAASLHAHHPGNLDLRANLCGDWVKMGMADEAMALLGRVPTVDAVTQVFARCAIAQAAAEAAFAELKIDTPTLLTEAENLLPAVPAPLHIHAAARLAVEWAREGNRDRALDLDSFGDRESLVRSHVAQLLADTEQPEDARRLFSDDASMPDELVTKLVDAALATGQPREAADLAWTRTSPDSRAALLARVACRGHDADTAVAAEVVQPALDLVPEIDNTYERREVTIDLGRAISHIYGTEELLGVVHNEWRRDLTPGAVVDILSFADPLFDKESELSIELANSLSWLRNSLPPLGATP
jgi:hypothetical protein